MQPILDTRLIAERRTQLELSQRMLARALGVGPAAMAAIEHGNGHERLTLRLVRMLAHTLGLEPADLLLRESATTREPAADDVKVEAVLAQSRKRLSREAIARALGWNLARTSAALATLAERLRATGQILHLNHSTGGYSLRPREGVLSKAEQEAVARARLRNTGLTPRQASLLLEVVEGRPSRRWTHTQSGADRADHGRLLKLGLVELKEGIPRLTETGRYNLGLPPQRHAKAKTRRRA